MVVLYVVYLPTSLTYLTVLRADGATHGNQPSITGERKIDQVNPNPKVILASIQQPIMGDGLLLLGKGYFCLHIMTSRSLRGV